MIKVDFKFMTLQTWKQTITIHILPNISRSKGNETMKFGQLIDYNDTQKVVEKLVPDPFLKNQNSLFLF